MHRTFRVLVESALVASVALCASPAAAQGDMLVSSRFSNNILRYDRHTGEFKGVFAQGPELANPNGIAFGPDGHLYVGLGDGDRVLKYHGRTGTFLGNFTAPGAGGTSSVRGIEFGPDGHLYVASAGNDTVLRFDGATGDYLGVAATRPGLDGPVGLAFDPAGRLYVAAALSNRVYIFDNGAFVRTLFGGVSTTLVAGLAWSDDGRLLVSYSQAHQILAFDVTTNTLSGVFTPQGPSLNIPIYMERGPDGFLYVSSFGTDSVVRVNASTGAVMGTFVPRGSGGLDGTHDIAFMPIPGPGAMAMVFVLPMIGRRRRDGLTSRRASTW